MEKDRSSRLFAILAMIIAVGGLSLGFAAFSNSLIIQPLATVSPEADTTFNVDFSSSSTSVIDGTLNGTGSPGVVAKEANIDNSGNPTISNLGATFKKPGDQVEYTFYAVNTSGLDAYLKSITFANVSDSEDKPIVCEAVAGTTQNVNAACSGIEIAVQVGSSEVFTSSKTSDNFTSTHMIGKNTTGSSPYNSELVKVTMRYASDAAVTDGDFNVKFGDITLVYSTLANS